MKVLITKNYRDMSKKGAEILASEIQKKQDITISFATGKTLRGVYKELVKKYKRGKLDFSKVKAFNLDEIYPVKRRDKKSFYHYLFKNLFNHVNINKSNIHLLNGETKNPARECRDYELLIKKNPIDLQILGLGTNGHIAFNEPGSPPTSKTRLVSLTPETIKRKKIPGKALSVGIKTILSAKKIILFASGKEKAEAVGHLLKGKKNKNWPVSFLKQHKNVVVVIDKKASIYRTK